MLSSFPISIIEILIFHILRIYLDGRQITSLPNHSEVAESYNPHVDERKLSLNITHVSNNLKYTTLKIRLDLREDDA